MLHGRSDHNGRCRSGGCPDSIGCRQRGPAAAAVHSGYPGQGPAHQLPARSGRRQPWHGGIGTIGGGLAGSLLGRPSPWNDGAQGLAREIASREGQVLVTVSVRHGLAALMHRNTAYQPCDCHGFGPRVAHALLETFTDRRDDGSRALSVPRFAGAYAGSFARMAWEPGQNAGGVAMGTTVSLGVSALFNVARELTGVGTIGSRRWGGRPGASGQDFASP